MFEILQSWKNGADRPRVAINLWFVKTTVLSLKFNKAKCNKKGML